MVASLALLLGMAPGLVLQSSQVEITPPEPLPLGGYTERKGALFEPGGDRLWSRTEVLTKDGIKVAIVSVELLTVPESLSREVQSRIPTDVHLFLAATHTHSAPDSQMLNDRMTFSIPGIASFKRKWLTWFADQIAKGINDALKSPAVPIFEVELQTKNLDLNRGRRTGVLPSKKAWTVLANHKPMLTAYAAHATLYDKDRLQLSGDWPGAVIQKRGGLFLAGAIGDVSPMPIGKSVPEQIQSFVKAFEKLPLEGNTVESSPLRWSDIPIKLESPKPHPTFAATNKIPEPLAQSLVEKFAPPSPRISGIRLGGLAIIGIPGEPTAEIGAQIESAGTHLGYVGVIVVSHVDGWMGYILTPPDYDRGGYEATLSFNGRETGDRVILAAIETLKSMR